MCVLQSYRPKATIEGPPPHSQDAAKGAPEQSRPSAPREIKNTGVGTPPSPPSNPKMGGRQPLTPVANPQKVCVVSRPIGSLGNVVWELQIVILSKIQKFGITIL